MGQQEEKTMNGFDDEVEAARRLLELRNERSGDFKFHKTDRPVMRCSDGHCVSAYDVEVTTKRRGVKIAAYVGGQEPSWLQDFEANLDLRRSPPKRSEERRGGTGGVCKGRSWWG